MFKNNKIYKIDKNGKRKRIWGFIPGLSIHFKGKNSIVEIHEPIAKFNRCKIKIKDSSYVSIAGSKHSIKKLQILGDSEQRFVIGKDFSSYSCDLITASEKGLSIEIGDYCMFAKNIIIRAADGHTVIDNNTGKAVNYGKSIKIGDKVWISGNCTILKGVNISNNCIIAHGSIVTKDCQSACVYGGNPAKIIKQNVSWLREAPIS